MAMPENYREWTTVDKAGWDRGPWDGEPDKVQWIDPATGLDCLINRAEGGGHWCGYVGVAAGHPWFEKGYSACVSPAAHEDDRSDEWRFCDHTPESLTKVHGGLTFADACAGEDDPSSGICHVAAPGRPDHVWWFGFDCAHAWDVSPRYVAKYGRSWTERGTYKERAYVEAEIRSLAQQLAAVST